MLDSASIVVFMMLWFAGLVLIGCIVLAIVMIIITFITKDKAWYTKLSKRLTE